MLRNVRKSDRYETRGRSEYRRDRARNIERAIEGRRRRVDESVAFLEMSFAQSACVGCGETAVAVLVLDHRPGTTKRFDPVKAAAKGTALAEVKREFGKCVVRCLNCRARLAAASDAGAEARAWAEIGAAAPEAPPQLLRLDEAAELCARHGLTDLAKRKFWINATDRGRIPCAIVARKKRVRLDVVQGLIDGALVECRPMERA